MNTTSKTILVLLGALDKTGAYTHGTTDEGMHGVLPTYDATLPYCPGWHGKIDNRDWKQNELFDPPTQAYNMYWWALAMSIEDLYDGQEPAECG